MSGKRLPLPAPTVRRVGPADAGDWLRMRCAVYSGPEEEHRAEIDAYFASPPDSWACLVADGNAEGVLGFTEVGLRGYAEGCRSSPVGYLEGIFVVETHRKRGVGRALLGGAEAWARERGCTEMASDRQIHNEMSGLFHAALGFEEVERIVCFRKSL